MEYSRTRGEKDCQLSTYTDRVHTIYTYMSMYSEHIRQTYNMAKIVNTLDYILPLNETHDNLLHIINLFTVLITRRLSLPSLFLILSLFQYSFLVLETRKNLLLQTFNKEKRNCYSLETFSILFYFYLFKIFTFLW